MKVIGIDPGSNVTGYGLVCVENNGYKLVDYGCIKPPRKLPISERRQVIFDGISHLLDQHQPEALSVETQYVKHNPNSALLLGMVRGIVILAATMREIPIFEYTPSKAKKAVSGKGQASKHQVQAMIQRLLCLPEIPEPEDAADALALAICHIHAANGKVI